MNENAREAAVDRRWRRGLIAAAALPALALAVAERYLFGDLAGFPLDDPWIHLQFARNLADGHGLSYDGGRLVAGSTAPLWTALVSVLLWLPGSAEAWVKAAGIAFHAASVGVAYGLGRRLGLARPRAALAAGLVALADAVVWSSVSGMEVPLFVLLSLAGISRHLAEREEPRRPPLSFLLLGLAALARPEGLLLPLLAAIDRTVVPDSGGRGLALSGSGARRAALGLALAAIVVVPVGLAYLAISGSPLPTTLAAKSAGPPQWIPQMRHLGAILDFLFAALPLPTLLAAGGAAVLVGRVGGTRDRGLLLPAWGFALPVATSMISSGEALLFGNFGRYFFPLLPVVALLAVVGLDVVPPESLRGLRIGRWRLPLAVPTVLLLLLLPAAVRTLRGGGLYLQARSNVEDSDVAAADWLAANVPADALLGLCDIGVIKYRLPNPIVDLAGIASPERRQYLDRMRREHGLRWPEALRLWLEEVRPEIVVIYPRWFPLLDKDPKRFPVLHRIAIPDNIAMGGDELVVYATPWTRPGIFSELVPAGPPPAR
jgi:hypothetical protein